MVMAVSTLNHILFGLLWYILHTALGSALSLMQHKPYSPEGCGLTYTYVWVVKNWFPIGITEM